MKPANPRGLIFTGALVPGVMRGEVTVTTRVMKPQPELDPKLGFIWKGRYYGTNIDGTPYLPNLLAQSPFRVGEKRYVKEACTRGKLPHILTGEPTEFETAVYAADGAPCLERLGFDLCPWWTGKSSSAMMMPRDAARTWIEILSVKPARCQDITEEEAIASGVKSLDIYHHLTTGNLYWQGGAKLTDERNPAFDPGRALNGARGAYAYLWNRLNARRGFPWSANPWCWRVTFRLTTEGAPK